MATDLFQSFAAQAFSTAVTKVEVRSAFSPPVVIDVRDALEPWPPGPPTTRDRILGVTKPTVIMSGVGKTVDAPWGLADTTSWKVNLGFLIGVGVALGVGVTMAIYKVGVFRGSRR